MRADFFFAGWLSHARATGTGSCSANENELLPHAIYETRAVEQAAAVKEGT